MIKLNTYINEVWGGVKKHTNNAEIETWCKEMGIQNYTINSKGEIDVDTSVNLRNKNLEELPYKFGKVTGFFSLTSNPNLISLKNCPNHVSKFFSCDDCKKLDSLEGAPQKVWVDFFCRRCKREFTEKEVRSLCEVKRDIFV